MKILILVLLIVPLCQSAPQFDFSSLFKSDSNDPPSIEKSFSDLLFNRLNDLYSSGHAQFASYSCQYSRRPDFRGLKLVFKASFSCPGLSRFTGKGLSSSPSGAIRDATIDFAKQAHEAGDITTEEAGSWLTAQ